MSHGDEVYKYWINNLNKLFQNWGGNWDELEKLTGIKKDNLYCIFSGSRRAHVDTLLFICKCCNSKPYQLINIPIES